MKHGTSSTKTFFVSLVLAALMGSTEALGTISVIVYDDLNANSVQDDPDEPGLFNVSVALGFDIPPMNGKPDFFGEFTKTDENGVVTFTGVSPGVDTFFIFVDKANGFEELEFSPQEEGGSDVNPKTGESDPLTVTTGDVTEVFVGLFEPPCAAFSCGNNNDKVEICHVPGGNPSKARTKCIGKAGAKTHYSNHGGDYCGPCP